jgi:hypothetical protein
MDEVRVKAPRPMGTFRRLVLVIAAGFMLLFGYSVLKADSPATVNVTTKVCPPSDGAPIMFTTGC